jgi:hypothetical protein
MDRDSEALRIYGYKYKDLCSKRKQIIDNLIIVEKRREADENRDNGSDKGPEVARI